MIQRPTDEPDPIHEAAADPIGSAPTAPSLLESSMQFVDTHAHLDEPAFDRDRAEVLRRSFEAGVTRIVNVGYSPARWRTTTDLVRNTPGISAILGLHPQSAAEFDDQTCDRLAEAIRVVGARAVGEIGLDYYRDQSLATATIQRRAFEAQLGLARDLGLPVVIHQRAAGDDCRDMLRATSSDLPVLLHCFEGDPALLALALDRGYLMGIGGVLTRSGSDALRAAVRSIPLDLLVLETDAPYLTPSGIKDRRNSPANVPVIAGQLAALLKLPLAEIAERTTANAVRFFGALPSSHQPSFGAAGAALAPVR